MSNKPVLPDDPGYEAMLKSLRANGGNLVKAGGVTYVAIKDNDVVKFFPTATPSLDSSYESQLHQPRTDVPMATQPEPTETSDAALAPRKTPSRRKGS